MTPKVMNNNTKEITKLYDLNLSELSEFLIEILKSNLTNFKRVKRLDNLNLVFDLILISSNEIFKASRTALGFLAAIRNKALAGPSGFLLPCSQFCKVLTLTPIMIANSFWVTFSFPLTLLISGGSI